MALDTYEKLESTFKDIIENVIENVSERAKKLLQEHINTDTYGINKSATFVMSPINKYYLENGTPSYEFRDQAWDIWVKELVRGYTFSLFYDGSNLTPPTSAYPFEHGNLYKHEDRRNELAEDLNVNGWAKNEDFPGSKRREPFWDNFEEDLKNKIGGWLYTEFKKNGVEIPAIRLYKGSFIG